MGSNDHPIKYNTMVSVVDRIGIFLNFLGVRYYPEIIATKYLLLFNVSFINLILFSYDGHCTKQIKMRILLSMEQWGLRPKKFQTSVAVPPASVRVPSQRSLAPCVASVTPVANDKGDNEMILGAVYRSPCICLTAEEKPRKPQLGAVPVLALPAPWARFLRRPLTAILTHTKKRQRI